MDNEALADISLALDQKFYQQRDSGLLEFLRSQTNEDEQRERIAEIARIDDVAVLDSLIQAGVRAETFVAFSLYPLIRVAWADGEISENERVAVLRAAADEGITGGSVIYQLLQGWLENRPDSSLEEAWQNYARSLARKLTVSDLASVQHANLSRARQVAEAAGGFLGLGNRISKNEELALLDLSHAFDKPADLH